MTLFVCSILAALSVSFLCSLMEAALLSITPSKIAVLLERTPAIGHLCQKFKDDIEKPIAVILILNTSAHTFGAAIAGAQFDKIFGSSNIWLFSLVFTVIMVQFTEILPKTLGVRFNGFLLRLGAPFLKFFIWLLAPLITLVHLLNRPFAVNETKEEITESVLTEIGALAAIARRKKQISSTQEQILRNTPFLKERTIESLMQPLSRVCVIPENYSRDEVLEKIRGNLHSRYPVCRAGDRHAIIGCLMAKDLLYSDRDWKPFMKPVTYIGTDIPQLNLIEDILVFDSKLLIVRNHSGKCIGMLTVNDVLMELLGKEYAATDGLRKAV